MIAADKKKTFRKLFFNYVKGYLLPRNFGYVFVEGEMDVEPGRPVLYIINHSSWWDGMMAFYLTESLSARDHYVMMDEEGLKKYPFFKKLGAFSVNKKKPRDLIETFRYTQKLLEEDKCVWLFPQGKVEHQEDLPYKFEQGLGRMIVANESIYVKPITLHYYFLEEQKPNVYIKIGAAHAVESEEHTRKEWVALFEDVLSKQYTAQRQALIDDIHLHDSDAFTKLTKPRRSTSDWLDQLKKVFK